MEFPVERLDTACVSTCPLCGTELQKSVPNTPLYLLKEAMKAIKQHETIFRVEFLLHDKA